MFPSALHSPLTHAPSTPQDALKGSFTARISEELQGARWEAALLTLQEMRERGEVPKLGAVQRWVRECDAKGGDALALRVLDGDDCCFSLSLRFCLSFSLRFCLSLSLPSYLPTLLRLSLRFFAVQVFCGRQLQST